MTDFLDHAKIFTQYIVYEGRDCMLSVERQQAVYEYIRTHHSASVAELSKHFFIS